MPNCPMRVLLLTEDSGQNATDSLKAVAREIFLLIEPTARMHRIRFEPLDDKGLSTIVRANMWRSANKNDYEARRRLCQSIATRLILEKSIVLFHYDGDRTWTKRATCSNRAQFAHCIVDTVRSFVRGAVAKAHPSTCASELDAIADEHMARLFQIVPFYSIEAWAYENVGEARRACAEAHPPSRHNPADHGDRFAAWAADPGVIEEVEKPKEVCCLRNHFNARLLSSGYPTNRIVALGQSFAFAHKSVSSSAYVRALLADTAV